MALCWLALATAGHMSTAVQLATPATTPGRPSDAVMAIVSQLQADPQLMNEVERELAMRRAELAIVSGFESFPRRLSSSGSGSVSGSGSSSASGSGGGCSFHSVFDLTCHPGEMPGSHCMFMDWMWFGLWLLVVVTLTVLIEAVFHHIEHVRRSSPLAPRALTAALSPVC